jgi:hypothetical protein
MARPNNDGPYLTRPNRGCQHRGMTVEDDLRAVMDAFEREGVELKAADDARISRRDEGLRAAKAGGMKQVEIIKFTGYSRETVRQALNPDAKQAAKDARVAKRRQP